MGLVPMMHPGADEVYATDPDEDEEALLRIIDNIRQYTCYGVLFTPYWPPQTSIDDAYVEQGLEDMSAYLAKHAAFEEFMSERSETDA